MCLIWANMHSIFRHGLVSAPACGPCGSRLACRKCAALDPVSSAAGHAQVLCPHGTCETFAAGSSLPCVPVATGAGPDLRQCSIAGSDLEEATLSNALSLAAAITLSVPPPCMIVEVRALAASFVPLKAASGASIRGFFAAAQPKPAAAVAAGSSTVAPALHVEAAGAEGQPDRMWQNPAPDPAAHELPWDLEAWQDGDWSSLPPEVHVGNVPSSRQSSPGPEPARAAAERPGPGAEASAQHAEHSSVGVGLPGSRPSASAGLHTASRPSTGADRGGSLDSQAVAPTGLQTSRMPMGPSRSSKAKPVQWQFASQAVAQQGVKRKPAIPPPTGGKQLKLSALLPRKANLNR